MAIVVSITCDGCQETHEVSAGIEDGVNVIETEIEEGWEHDGEDFCPKCVKAGS